MANSKPRCKELVWSDCGFRRYQCSRYAVVDDYCRQHHPDAVAERQRKRAERQEQQWQNSPQMRLERALKKVTKLEAYIDKLEIKVSKLEVVRDAVITHRDNEEFLNVDTWQACVSAAEASLEEEEY